MFGNIVLDVFIGLVLVYLLYSLFITIFGEMIATWMALRSRILRVAIEKMLNDGMHNKNYPDRTFWQRCWNIVQRYFLKEFKDFKYSLGGKFYASPSIKYLSDNGGEYKTAFSQTKPSYISADVFAETLIQLLKDKGTGATDIEKLKFCLKFNTHHIEFASLKHLRDMAENAGDDINVLKAKLITWYNETMDRATGWYKRRLQLILFWLGLIVAIIFNVDTIQIAKILSKDKDARDQLVSMGIALSRDSARYKDFVVRGDTLHSQEILDSGYARVTKDIDEANMVLGLGWPLANLMKNDIRCFDRKKDSASFALLKEYQPIFNGFAGTFNNQQNKSRVDKKISDSLRQRLLIYKKDSAVFSLEQLFATDSTKKELDDTLKKTISLIESTTNRLDIAQTRRKMDSAGMILFIQSRNEATRQVNAYTSMKFVLIDSIIIDTTNKNEAIVVYTRRPYSTLEKIGYVLRKCNPFSSAFWSFIFSIQFLGLFITALMLSLGAPFWFDLLKKLVAIRGAGVKPEEKKNTDTNSNIIPVVNPNGSNGGPNNPNNAGGPIRGDDPVGDVFEEAVRIYASEIRKIPGVKSVFPVSNKRNKQEKSLQINVDNITTEQEVATRFPKLIIGDSSVKYEIVVSGTPVSHQGNKGNIANKSGKNVIGTLGCTLRRKDTQSLHILSCWHVMKGDLNYSASDTSKIIVDFRDNDYAERWGGNLQGMFDYGIARNLPHATENFNTFLISQLKIQEKIDFRTITSQDIDEQIDIKYFDCINNVVKEGFIFSDTKAVNITYPDKTREMNDVLILTNDQKQTISEAGNSGSIIFDTNNKAIAMIISGDLQYTYAVKLSHIFELHDEMEIA